VLDDGHRPRIVEAIEIDPQQAHPGLLQPPQARHYASITVSTGKFHEVRRIFAAAGSEVLALCRVRFGSIELGDLERAQWRAIDLRAHFRDMVPT
jgi:16S rRNA pseudouridine516 synthase